VQRRRAHRWPNLGLLGRRFEHLERLQRRPLEECLGAQRRHHRPVASLRPQRADHLAQLARDAGVLALGRDDPFARPLLSLGAVSGRQQPLD
jgi:hypothetical protein